MMPISANIVGPPDSAIPIGPDIGAPLAARLADEWRLKIREPSVVLGDFRRQNPNHWLALTRLGRGLPVNGCCWDGAISSQLGFQMSSFDHSLAAITDRRLSVVTDTVANLNVQLCELNLLRERVRKAELASRRRLYRRKRTGIRRLELGRRLRRR